MIKKLKDINIFLFSFIFIFLISFCEIALSQEVNKEEDYKRSRLTSDKSEIEADKRYILLTTGEDKVIDLDFDAHAKKEKGISIGNIKVVTTTLVKIGEKKQLVLKPLSAGHTTIGIRDADGELRLILDINVTDSNLAKTKKELEDLLGEIEGINVRILNNRIIIDGEILVPNDFGRIFQVLGDETFAGIVSNLSTLSPVALSILANKIQSDIQVFAPNVTARVVNSLIWLEGSVESSSEAKRAKQVAELYLPNISVTSPIERVDTRSGLVKSRDKSPGLIQNFIVINPKPKKRTEKLVRVTMHFVELSKDYQKLFGFKWQPSFTADPSISFGSDEEGATGAVTGTFAATISSLLPRLASAQQAGFARILKTGTVVVKNGQPAKLVDQAEVPFQAFGSGGQAETQKTNFGIVMAVTPKLIGGSEDVELDVDMKQNAFGGLNGNSPITTKHEVKTKLFVKNNESAAISGVVSHDVSTSFNKDDPHNVVSDDASTIPLFQLIRSKKFVKKKSQFVIFITPQLLENASSGTEDLKKNFRVKVQ